MQQWAAPGLPRLPGMSVHGRAGADAPRALLLALCGWSLHPGPRTRAACTPPSVSSSLRHSSAHPSLAITIRRSLPRAPPASAALTSPTWSTWQPSRRRGTATGAACSLRASPADLRGKGAAACACWAAAAACALPPPLATAAALPRACATFAAQLAQGRATHPAAGAMPPCHAARWAWLIWSMLRIASSWALSASRVSDGARGWLYLRPWRRTRTACLQGWRERCARQGAAVTGAALVAGGPQRGDPKG